LVILTLCRLELDRDVPARYAGQDVAPDFEPANRAARREHSVQWAAAPVGEQREELVQRERRQIRGQRALQPEARPLSEIGDSRSVVRSRPRLVMGGKKDHADAGRGTVIPHARAPADAPGTFAFTVIG
jgi:hypothetical protein